MEAAFSHNIKKKQIKFEKLLGLNSRMFYFILVCVISVSLIQNSYAQTQLSSEEQITLSGNLQNDPIAQDILKKIEQTKKMIEELKQKEYEQNQAKENLEKVRKLSIERLNQKLDEWERLWEKHSSKNSFDRFVNKKPSWVQGVFWDQFEFKEQKVNAGRTAMNQVLTNGGPMEDARNAYNNAASTPKIELIEMNAQFNVKHNLAYYAEQQLFNSTGQIHLSPATQVKLASFYGDYKTQPSYIMANSDDANTSEINSDTQCEEGLILVSRVTSGSHSCIDESTAKKWISNGVKGIIISNDVLSISQVKTNPGTQCEEGHQVVYHIATSEYQCVLESVAKEMIGNNTAEIHTLTEYILNKDKQKVTEDAIHEINLKILRINEEYDIKKKELESKYDENLENENILAKQKIQDLIQEYRTDGNITKEDVTKRISELRNTNEDITEKILQEKLDAINKLESELKDRLLETVKGYENNSNINVDWDYLNETPDNVSTVSEKGTVNLTKVSSVSDENIEKMYLDNIGVVNSFGQEFDEIKTDQVLQIAADLTNTNEYKQDFVYVVEITDIKNVLAQRAKWVTGTLYSSQTFNVGLSWTPKETGEYTAVISIGTEIDSVSQVAEIKINVNPEGNISDYNYCKNGHELLFKYSDNSPICASPDIASKLINRGLAFA
ncbi:MAG: hypothetical protein V3V58_02760 [Nitrosopumilaceae archaeon]